MIIKNNNQYKIILANIRVDKKIDEAYLDGRYGGIPLLEPVKKLS